MPQTRAAKTQDDEPTVTLSSETAKDALASSVIEDQGAKTSKKNKKKGKKGKNKPTESQSKDAEPDTPVETETPIVEKPDTQTHPAVFQLSSTSDQSLDVDLERQPAQSQSNPVQSMDQPPVESKKNDSQVEAEDPIVFAIEPEENQSDLPDTLISPTTTELKGSVDSALAADQPPVENQYDSTDAKPADQDTNLTVTESAPEVPQITTEAAPESQPEAEDKSLTPPATTTPTTAIPQNNLIDAPQTSNVKMSPKLGSIVLPKTIRKSLPAKTSPLPKSITSKPSSTADKTATAKPSQPRVTSTPKTGLLAPPLSAASKRQSVAGPLAAVKSIANGSKPENASKTTTDYLASKRRPISMHFPMPAPPAKSQKQPTHPTFTLPGDTITAKRKAAMDEKLKKEADELVKKREFKARPLPSTVRPRPASMIVRPTATSIARQSIMGGPPSQVADSSSEKENGSSQTKKAVTGLRRAGTVTGATTTSSTSSLKRSTVVKPTATQTTASANRRQTTAPTGIAAASTTAAPKRLSVAPRKPLSQRPASAAAATTGASTAKTGISSTASKPPPSSKPAIARATIDPKDRERLRKEKEDATKRARADAAEKSREKSREWAEKNRVRKPSATLTATTGIKAKDDKPKGKVPVRGQNQSQEKVVTAKKPVEEAKEAVTDAVVEEHEIAAPDFEEKTSTPCASAPAITV